MDDEGFLNLWVRGLHRDPIPVAMVPPVPARRAHAEDMDVRPTTRPRRPGRRPPRPEGPPVGGPPHRPRPRGGILLGTRFGPRAGPSPGGGELDRRTVGDAGSSPGLLGPSVDRAAGAGGPVGGAGRRDLSRATRPSMARPAPGTVRPPLASRPRRRRAGRASGGTAPRLRGPGSARSPSPLVGSGADAGSCTCPRADSETDPTRRLRPTRRSR